MPSNSSELWRGTSTELVWSLDQIVDDIRHGNLDYYDMACEDAFEALRQLTALADSLRTTEQPVTLADVPRKYRTLVATSLIREREHFAARWDQIE